MRQGAAVAASVASGAGASVALAAAWAIPIQLTRSSCRRGIGTIRQLLGKIGLTRLVNEQDIRTPQHIKNRARNDPGILATDINPHSPDNALSFGVTCAIQI